MRRKPPVKEPDLPLSTPGVRTYLVVCEACAAATVLPLLMRGLGSAALWPALVGILLGLARWRTGPVMFLLSLAWLVVADSMGLGPFQLIERLFIRPIGSLLGVLEFLPLYGNAGRRLHEPRPLPDILLAVAVVGYCSAYYRMLSVVLNVLPPEKARPRGALTRRAPGLVRGSEAVQIAALAVICAVLGQLFWVWLQKRSIHVDLARLRPLGADSLWSPISDGVWRVWVAVWVAVPVLVMLAGVLGHLATRRLSPDEAALFLQDQLWRQTRREQARLNRWLAWAEKRQARRRKEG